MASTSTWSKRKRKKKMYGIDLPRLQLLTFEGEGLKPGDFSKYNVGLSFYGSLMSECNSELLKYIRKPSITCRLLGHKQTRKSY